MKTDDLIRTLAADQRRPPASMQQLILGALVLGLAGATALFLWRVKMRPDFMVAMHDPLFIHKFLVTLGLAIPAAGLLLRLLRPGAPRGIWQAAVVIGPVILGLGILYELMMFDPATWMRRLVGSNRMVCMRTIPLLSIPLLAALLVAMRWGAPTRPALAGAVAGLTASGIAATLYAAHCVDDSPLFVMAWYGLSILVVTVIGMIAGWRLLRW
jgi:hypothetical protein